MQPLGQIAADQSVCGGAYKSACGATRFFLFCFLVLFQTPSSSLPSFCYLASSLRLRKMAINAASSQHVRSCVRGTRSALAGHFTAPVQRLRNAGKGNGFFCYCYITTCRSMQDSAFASIVAPAPSSPLRFPPVS